MTGIYLRVKRDDKYENLEFEDLTDFEVLEHFKSADKETLINWITTLKNITKAVKDMIERDIK